MDVVLSDVTVRVPPNNRLLFHIAKLALASGSSTLIHGASGIGKTTLLHLIAGLFLPQEGSVLVGGTDLCLLSDHERGMFRRRHLGMIFQRLNLIDHFTVMVTRFEAMKTQVAVLRALGFSLNEILRWLLWEGALLGIVACLAGALMDAMFFPSVRSLLGTALPSDEVAASHFYLAAPVWLISLLATIIAVIIPIVQISRQDVHSSLKGL